MFIVGWLHVCGVGEIMLRLRNGALGILKLAGEIINASIRSEKLGALSCTRARRSGPSAAELSDISRR